MWVVGQGSVVLVVGRGGLGFVLSARTLKVVRKP